MWKYSKYVSKAFIEKFTDDLIEDLYNDYMPIKNIRKKYNYRMCKHLGVKFKLMIDDNCKKTKISNHLKSNITKIKNKKVLRKLLSLKKRYFMGMAQYDFDKIVEINLSFYAYLAIKNNVNRKTLHKMLYDTIAHEVTHACQHRNRRTPGFIDSGKYGDFDEKAKNAEKSWKKYLSCQSEIEAYAIGMACYLDKVYINKKIAMKALEFGFCNKFPARWNQILLRIHKLGDKKVKHFLETASGYLNDN